MGGPEVAPQASQRSEGPGRPGPLLENAIRSEALTGAPGRMEPRNARRIDGETSRRDFLRAAGRAAAGVGLVSVVAVRPVRATPATMQEAIRRVVGAAPVRPGRVKLELPPLSENGHAVPLTVSVESAMTEAEHVRAIHVFSEINPLPDVAAFRLGPRAGRARVSTRIRLANTQTVVAIGELSDGSFWSDRAHVIVTLAACLEEA
jgi:sulfur-oxidizing protein SoxY